METPVLLTEPSPVPATHAVCSSLGSVASPSCEKELGNRCKVQRPLDAAEQWEALPKSRLVEVLVTEELLKEAAQAFRRAEWTFFYQLLAVALPLYFSATSARKALRGGHVQVDGSPVMDDKTASPSLGARVIVRVGSVDDFPPGLSKRLNKYNRASARPEAQIRILFHDEDAGWAVVNKPAGMHSNPNPTCYGKDALTFQDYLPALLPPPRVGMHCRSPKVCHRLDFRVSGPMVVATSLEAERALAQSFEEHRVHKEYRAIVCGIVGEVGETLSVSAPVDGLVAETRVEVLRIVPCRFFGELSELRLWPITGRRQQLRKHCAIELGAAIVNEEPALFEASAPAWALRHGGTTLPPARKRGSGKLFLQAVQVDVPRPASPCDVKVAVGDESGVLSVRADVADQFEELLQNATSCWAWERDHDRPTYTWERGDRPIFCKVGLGFGIQMD